MHGSSNPLDPHRDDIAGRARLGDPRPTVSRRRRIRRSFDVGALHRRSYRDEGAEVSRPGCVVHANPQISPDGGDTGQPDVGHPETDRSGQAGDAGQNIACLLFTAAVIVTVKKTAAFAGGARISWARSCRRPGGIC